MSEDPREGIARFSVARHALLSAGVGVNPSSNPLAPGPSGLSVPAIRGSSQEPTELFVGLQVDINRARVGNYWLNRSGVIDLIAGLAEVLRQLEAREDEHDR